MKKRITFAVAAITVIAMILTLGGCMNPIVHIIDTAQGTETSEPIEVPSLPEKAVEKLRCFKVDGFVSDIVYAGDLRVAVVSQAVVYDPDNSGVSDGHGVDFGDGIPQTLYMIDMVGDRVISEHDFPSDQTLLGIRRNGEIISCDSATDSITVFDGTMKPLRTFEKEKGSVIYDRDADLIYIQDDKTIETVDIDSGERRTVFQVGWESWIFAFDHVNGRIAVDSLADNEDSGKELLLYTLGSPDYTVLRRESVPMTEFVKGALVSIDTVYENDADTLDQHISVHPVDGGEIREYKFGGDPTIDFFPDCDSALCAIYSYADDTGETLKSEYRALDMTNGVLSAEIAEIGNASYVIGDWFDDCGRLVVGANFYDMYDEGERIEPRSELYMIAPDLLVSDRTLDAVVADSEEEAGEQFSLAADFADQRAKADALEQKYGVEIMLGNEVYNAAPNETYDVVSTEDSDNEESLNALKNSVDLSLDQLDNAYSEYPDGFFATFRTSRGQGGLRILIVEQLVNHNGEFSAGGVFYRHGAWFNVVICIAQMESVTDTIHHETWHAVEQRILDEKTDAFNYDGLWDELNPDGFEYQYNFDNYYENDDYFKYTIPWDEYSDPDDVYFMQIYSTVTEMEDRATLIEAVMGSSYRSAFANGTKSGYEWITSFPHLKAKLDYMGRQTEEIFGSVYWEQNRK